MSFRPKIKGVVNDMMGVIPCVREHKKGEGDILQRDRPMMHRSENVKMTARGCFNNQSETKLNQNSSKCLTFALDNYQNETHRGVMLLLLIR